MTHLSYHNWKAINIKYKNNYSYSPPPKGGVYFEDFPTNVICDHNQCISEKSLLCYQDSSCKAFENVGCRVPELYKFYNFVVFNQTDQFKCKCSNNLCTAV